eukprot:c50682_g1_i1 orf=57-338(+)
METIEFGPSPALLYLGWWVGGLVVLMQAKSEQCPSVLLIHIPVKMQVVMGPSRIFTCTIASTAVPMSSLQTLNCRKCLEGRLIRPMFWTKGSI